MKKSFFTLSILFSFLLYSCSPGGNSSEKTGTQEQEENGNFSLEQVWETSNDLLTPESVIYDEDNNVLYVSNVNQNPSEKDNNGFISKLGTDGEILELHWIDGLNGPKGMAIKDDNLYVTDIDQLVVIDIPGGEIKEKIDVDGAGFLNDLALDSNGDLYFSDSDQNTIYVYKDGDVTVWLDEGLERPNGLYIDNGGVYLASSGSSDLVRIDKNSQEKSEMATGIGNGDGLEYTGMDGYYLVSDWSGEVFLVGPDQEKKSLLKTKDQEINSADIEFIPSEKLLLVPTFFDNRVVAYKLIED